MKVKVIMDFNDLQDKKHRNIGDVFECSLDRAEFLLNHNAVEFLEKVEVEEKETPDIELEETKADEITEEEVQAVADAIVDEAEEQDKSVEEIVKEIQEEKPKNKKGKK